MSERKTAWTAAELLNHEFPPVLWLVPNILTAGLTVLAGSPKLGKSWLALAIGSAVSVGGAVLSKIRVPEHKVLYLSLEDTGRRLQNRLQKIEAMPTDNLHFFLEWKRGTEGIELIRKWMSKHPDTKLIVIDTWGRFSKVTDGNDYGQVTDAAAELKSICDEYELAALIVHHTNKKTESADWMDSILGSTALNAAADSTMLLRRGRGNRDATLSLTGRDIEEMDYALNFDNTTGTWALIGTTAEVQESTARQEIYDYIKESGPAGPKDIHDGMKKDGAKRTAVTVRRLLGEMVESGSLINMGGIYSIKTSEPHEQYELMNSKETPETHEHHEQMNSNGGNGVHEFTEFTAFPPEQEEFPIF